ncbi:MAG: CPBP family intramembrane metalloprotease [Ruminococcus sp.]|nr:CPBP family intramembrane metalloprotease [Ruminococcus sp.]MCM1382517.1 CPBP family intramembrane metalloprotease [Muribaculaceae bacterium]MCM1478920.1 CPBP family intramembrane metalloprotease [Muribaculaceae bacterium]
MNNSKKISAWRAIAAALSAIVALVVSQLLATLIGSGITALGVPKFAGNLVDAALYLLFTLLLLKVISGKILGVTLAECRITRYKIKPLWAAAAFIMPAIVVAGLLLTAGHWENSPKNGLQIADCITTSVFVAGLSVGAVEEAVFRGVMMKALEMRWGKAAAVIAPSVLFGAAHVMNGGLSIVSFIQLLVAGSVVGILFSLVTYESGSIWSSALMHGVWNMCMGTGILNIYTEPSEGCIFNYVLESKSALVTGGEFGVEASVISIGAYLIFTAAATVLIKKNSQKGEKI